MAGNREIHGEVVLDVELTGEERARERMREAFANLEATVNVNADFNRQQVQAALDKVAGKGVKVKVDATFNLTQMRKAAREAAARGNGISVNVDAKFNRQQMQRALIGSSAGLKVLVDVDTVGGGAGRGAISKKLQQEYVLAARAAAADPKAAQAAVAGVNRRIGAFAAASQRMKEITAKAEIDRVRMHEAANLAISAEDRKAMREAERRMDKLADERRKDANKLLHENEALQRKIRLEEVKTAELRKRLEAEVEAGRTKFDEGVRAQAEKEQQKRLTRQHNNESDAARAIAVLQERGDEQRLTARERTLGRLEIREDAHVKRLIELSSASTLRREVIEEQFRARQALADRAFEQRRILAAERAQRNIGSKRSLFEEAIGSTNKISSSLGEFDRAVTRTLFVTLKAFTAWSAGVTAAVAAVGTVAVATFAQFELAATRAAGVSASSALNDELARTGKNLHSFAVQFESDRERIEKRAIQVSLQTIGFDPTEVSAGIMTLLQAGQTLPEALENIGNAAKFAQINGAGLDETATNLAAAMGAAGLKAKDTKKFLDQVQLSSQNALGGASDFLESLANRTSATARAYGQTNQEAQVLIQLLANTGVTGREAGTQGYIVFRDLNKVLGQSRKELQAAGIDTSTFASYATGVAEAFGQVKREGGNVFQFGKDLGFTAKSIGSVLQIIPQLEQEGIAGFNRRLTQLKNANGIVEQQVGVQRKTIAAQFDNMLDTIKAASIRFGEAAADPVRNFFDEFAGEGGLLDQASGRITEFGTEFGQQVQKIVDFVQTDDFRTGVENLVDTVTITLGGVADAFSAFSSALNDGDETASTFVAITESIKAFAQVSAEVLPKVARILGQIFDLLIEHADSFETFAKIAVGVYIVRKAYALLIKPVAESALAIGKFNTALIAAQETSASGTLLSSLSAVAGKFGLIKKEAEGAALAVEVAQSAVFAQGGRRVAGGAAAAIGTTGASAAAQAAAGNALAGFGQAARVERGFNAATETATAGAKFEKIAAFTPKVSKFAGIFAKIEKTILRLIPAAVKTLPVIGKLAEGFAKFAGPVGLAIAAIEAIVGVVKGFFEELNRGKGGSSDFAKTMQELQPIFHALGETVKAVFNIVMDILGIVGRVGKTIGRLLGGIVRELITNMGDSLRGFKALLNGDIIGALKAFGDVFVNTFTAPFRLALGAVLDLVADVIDSLKYLDKFVPGTPVRDVSNAIHEAGENVRDFRLNLSEATGAANETTDAVKKTGEASKTAAEQMVASSNLTLAQSQKAIAAHRAAFDAVISNTAFLRQTVQGTFANAVTPAVKQAEAAVVDLRSAVGGFQAQVDVTGPAAARAWGEQQLAVYANEAAVNQLRGQIANFGARAAASIGGIHGKLEGMAGGAAFAATQVGGIKGAFYEMKSAAAGTVAGAIADLAALGTAADEAKRKIQQARGDAAIAQAYAKGLISDDPFIAIQQQGLLNATVNNPQIMAAQQRIAREAAIRRQVRQGAADQKIVADEQRKLGLGGTTPAAGSTAQPAQRQFVDPDDAIQASLDRLKPAAKIAEVQKLVDAAQDRSTQALARTGKGAKDVADGMALTRRQTLLLAEAMPTLDKAVEDQRGKVQKLEEALQSLQTTQLAGTKAFSDAAFANDQAIKALQLQRINLLIGGASEGSTPIVDLDKQIAALQQQAEKASLEESLQLDPLRRKLEDTFNPVKEDSFDNIVAKFKELSTARDTETAKLATQEATQQRLNAALQTAQTRYEKIDAAAQKSVEAFNQAQQAASSTATSISSVGTSAQAGATQVNNYSKAVENVPTGKGVVDKSLKGINDRVKTLAPQFQGAGDAVMVAFLQGINRTWGSRVQPALTSITSAIPSLLDNSVPGAEIAGGAIMGGFLQGMKNKFGEKTTVGTIAWYLGTFIPDWIIKNKGPVAYDATILVPAGEAVMQGFHRGLKSGFSDVAGFVREVGPSLSEFISGDAFSKRTATVMADIAVGKVPDIEGVFGDLRPIDIGYGPGGAIDPSLSYLHPSLSYLDTKLMAETLAKQFGLDISAMRFDHNQFTSTGKESDHHKGLAADFAVPGLQTPDPKKDALAAALKPLFGKVFSQIIYRDHDLNRGFAVGGHMNHVHAAWMAGKGFSIDSKKIGYTDIPGASDRIDAAIGAASRKYGVELALMAAIAKQESHFNPNAGSPAGAQGLFQFMPGTAKGFGINPWNVEEAADGGARYLRNLLQKFGGRYDLAMAGYNAGPNAPGLADGKLPPYAETRNYVRLVTQYLDEFRKQFGGFREMGGPVSPGKAYVVGEKRPEIFVPRTAGTILPDARATLSAGSHTTYQDNRTIHNEVHTAATDPEAVIDVLEARTRSRMTGVNFR